MPQTRLFSTLRKFIERKYRVGSIFPDKKEFIRLARLGNVIPVAREILADLETPVSAYLKLRTGAYDYLLESVEGGETLARYSFIGGEPSRVFKSKGRRIFLKTPGKKEVSFVTSRDPLFELEKILKGFKQAPVSGMPPFSGGAVGYLGYDAVRFIEKIPDKNKSAVDIPDAVFIFTETLIAFDHRDKKIKVICNAFLDDFKNPGAAYESACQKIEQILSRLRTLPVPLSGVEAGNKKQQPLQVTSNFSKGAFTKAVQKAKRHIKMGDIIQVVLSQAFRCKITADPFNVYRALRSINPSPYMFTINCSDFDLVGSSPEVHVRCEGRKAELRPIAGTRPRGADRGEDLRFEKELLNDPKEKAEHLMLVDLGRNDLGRVCDYKSVKVTEFMTVERYSHVMHLVSHVEGTLKKGRSLFDLLRATFPAGTISGAPKVRAMQIIDELENQKRGFYSGIVGYFSYSGNLDSCIAIRTLLVKDKTAYVQAGAGIVADSDPKKEYQETVHKAKALIQAVEVAESGAL